jgi:hypothetical protein
MALAEAFPPRGPVWVGIHVQTTQIFCRAQRNNWSKTTFLASDKAWAVTGELIVATGGAGQSVYY